MELWTEKPIKSLGTVVTGKTPSKAQSEFYANGEHLFISPKDLDWNQFYVTDTETRITEKALEKHKNQVLPKNSVLFTSLSFAFGKMGITSQPSLTNQQINSIIVNEEHDFRFVYYLLQQYRPTIFSYNSGIDTPIVPKSVFESILVKYPKLETQRKIAAILSAYDDLIENNQRRITLLEAMAEEIYREWFVRFRFPGHKIAEFEKGVPKGWERQSLLKLCSVIKRGISPKYSDGSSKLVINQKCIRDGRIDLSQARTHDSKVPDDKYIQFGDALINSTGVGTLGRVSVVEFSPENITVDSHVTICRAEPSKICPVYLGKTVEKMQHYFEFMAAGSTGQVELNKSLISKIEILTPDQTTQTKFREFIEPIFNEKQTLFAEIDNLSKTKNLLLPRLISGKLSVEDLDIQFPPSMQAEAD
ncbi:restriction endonuclease subunit S [Gilvimarinus sp. 1_MG-2023]|uniref:restriction endonuclease subunit S n=1 Tax=Gilvimarinus sp. 1_MG-2023 TaxID=3062638 RepID=UPI0026E152D7|nr:restriction endonuclease subunit S [Gilvimarinus sp. 1_MG-2023]MDO6746702.1 restriction endonuclease subunit S [Gilvimarinus sp. 1_MG-2023]